MTASVGRLLVAIGLAIALVGALAWLAPGSLRWMGRLPGDIRGEHFSAVSRGGGEYACVAGAVGRGVGRADGAWATPRSSNGARSAAPPRRPIPTIM